MKIANAFSISMLPAGRVTTAYFRGPIAAYEMRQWLKQNVRPDAGVGYEKLESVIGHADTARLVSDHLGIDLPMNRQSVKLELGEAMLVAQYSGPRLPEGAKELPEGAKFEYFIVTIGAVE